jgi:DNA topoisomerase VI subunit B
MQGLLGNPPNLQDFGCPFTSLNKHFVHSNTQERFMIDLETNDIAYLSSKRKRDAARTAILQARQALDHAAEEVDNYLEKFRDAETDTEKATAVNWCIHYLASNVVSSLRLEHMANAQTELSRQSM